MYLVLMLAASLTLASLQVTPPPRRRCRRHDSNRIRLFSNVLILLTGESLVTRSVGRSDSRIGRGIKILEITAGLTLEGERETREF